jgi:hypothetical protein
MSKECFTQGKNAEIILQVALSSTGHSNLRNIHVSSVSLMCELGYDKFEEMIKDMIEPLRLKMEACSDNPGL